MNNSSNTVDCGITNNFYDSGGTGANYANNESFTITFSPSNAGQYIRLNFTSFNLNDDFISFYDGTSTSDPLIGTFSNLTGPGSIGASNTSGSITVQFTSNSVNTANGWQATISCLASPVYPSISIMTDGAVFTSCAATFYDNGGTSNYSENLNQTMTFYPENAGDYVRLDFTSFNLNDDSLSFYNGTSTSSPLMGTYSNTTGPGTIGASSASGAITVQFRSNSFNNSSGWQASVSCSANPVFPSVSTMTDGVNFVSCNATFYDNGGTDNYSNSLNQTMTFYPESAGDFVRLNFNSFNLNDDFMSFYDGISTSAPLIGTYSNTTGPGSIGASNASGAITVQFSSNSFNNSSGWQATITCSETPVYPTVLTMTDGAEFVSCGATFYDYGGSGNYINNLNQTMTLYPRTPNESIRLNFNSFNLNDDFISFYDGISTSAPLIGTFTGNTSPGTIDANNGSGAITVQFTSNSFNTAAGWQATISCFPNPLPIELLSFSVYEQENTVFVKWVTATETNNDYFTIERSLDGINWEGIMTIPGAGNSNQTISYSAVDYFPHEGLSYYRLKQTDYNATFEYSQIVALLLNPEPEINVYPNPVLKEVRIRGSKAKISEIQVLDLLGKNLTHLSNMRYQEGEVEVDLSGLPQGIYFIKVQSTTKKVYKQ